MINLKADINSYNTTRGFLGTMARRMRYKVQKWGENFKHQGQKQRCLNPKAKLHQRQDQLRYYLGSAKGTAEEQQLPLRVC